MATLTNYELKEVKKIKMIQKKLTFSRYFVILALFCLLVAVITKLISPIGILVGLIVSLLMHEITMLRHDGSEYLLEIIQKYLTSNLPLK